MQKHRQISEELRTEIATGMYGDAGRLPSEAQLVERFGYPGLQSAALCKVSRMKG